MLHRPQVHAGWSGPAGHILSCHDVPAGLSPAPIQQFSCSRLKPPQSSQEDIGIMVNPGPHTFRQGEGIAGYAESRWSADSLYLDEVHFFSPQRPLPVFRVPCRHAGSFHAGSVVHCCTLFVPGSTQFPGLYRFHHCNHTVHIFCSYAGGERLRSPLSFCKDRPAPESGNGSGWAAGYRIAGKISTPAIRFRSGRYPGHAEIR
ncbi:MAG: hypothetical protein A4E34_02453 [Methanoregula sp. PtaU1.Bin006]|nr:MAG: hypothetical protein A4E33_00200 [Methanoregula sp. PtaB.Bin085]OPY32081.1 MAG: hypothetical protein A4E34_02453 [Methanoregula sp. PtaU1.Bin006]